MRGGSLLTNTLSLILVASIALGSPLKALANDPTPIRVCEASFRDSVAERHRLIFPYLEMARRHPEHFALSPEERRVLQRILDGIERPNNSPETDATIRTLKTTGALSAIVMLPLIVSALIYALWLNLDSKPEALRGLLEKILRTPGVDWGPHAVPQESQSEFARSLSRQWRVDRHKMDTVPRLFAMAAINSLFGLPVLGSIEHLAILPKHKAARAQALTAEALKEVVARRFPEALEPGRSYLLYSKDFEGQAVRWFDDERMVTSPDLDFVRTTDMADFSSGKELRGHLERLATQTRNDADGTLKMVWILVHGSFGDMNHNSASITEDVLAPGPVTFPAHVQLGFLQCYGGYGDTCLAMAKRWAPDSTSFFSAGVLAFEVSFSRGGYLPRPPGSDARTSPFLEVGWYWIGGLHSDLLMRWHDVYREPIPAVRTVEFPKK